MKKKQQSHFHHSFPDMPESIKLAATAAFRLEGGLGFPGKEDTAGKCNERQWEMGSPEILEDYTVFCSSA
jgi:hypothetical protein